MTDRTKETLGLIFGLASVLGILYFLNMIFDNMG